MSKIILANSNKKSSIYVISTLIHFVLGTQFMFAIGAEVFTYESKWYLVGNTEFIPKAENVYVPIASGNVVIGVEGGVVGG